MVVVKFSIIVVTYNRAELMNKFLTQFRYMEYPPSLYEVIIVDNGSTDYTLTVCIQAKKALSNLRYVYESRGGQSFARNTGISAAKYSHILFLDDDEQFPSIILQQYAAAWKRHPKSYAIGGKILPRLEKNIRNKTGSPISREFGWMLGKVDYGDLERGLEYPEALFSGNLSLHVQLRFRSAPIFNTKLGRRLVKHVGLGAEDYELCLRVLLQHRKIVYTPITVYNTIRMNRISLQYQLLRSFLAGIEHNIIDRNLTKKYKKHIAFYL